MTHGTRRAALVGTLVGTTLLVAGCAEDSPSTLAPAGPRSEFTATAWWILFGVAAAVCVLVIAAAVLAPLLRRRARRVSSGEKTGTVVVLGIVLPSLVFAGTFALGLVGLQGDTVPPEDPAAVITITGQQWWWQAEYADGEGEPTGAVTANEIHVPVGEPVRLRLSSSRVIHSFWVPELMPKIDLLPGRVNETWLVAEEPGTYRGQCAEYCGIQHANMGFHVVAEPREEYDAWLARQSEDAAEPTTEEERLGYQVVTTSTCATCHTVRGTPAQGEVGPDLTHLASREWLAAGTVRNDRGHLAGWVSNSQTIKPGNVMPPQDLSPEELRAVVTYLESLE
jgi:cytochrome c oxidase subunit 2